jgi:hypothetical protein
MNDKIGRRSSYSLEERKKHQCCQKEDGGKGKGGVSIG